MRVNHIKKPHILIILSVLVMGILIIILSVKYGHSKIITSDGNGYYAWLRSLAIDGDIDFKNDFEKLYYPDPVPTFILTPKHLVHNKYPIGVSIVEIPGFIVGHILAKLLSFPCDGISLPYQVSIGLWLMILALYSFHLYFLYLKSQNISDKTSLCFMSMAILSTNVIHYVLKEPSMSHGVGISLINILLFFSIQRSKLQTNALMRFMIGCLLGLLVLVRNTNIVFVPILLFLIKKSSSLTWRQIGTFFFGICPVLSLQFVALFILWGKIIINSYTSESFNHGIAGIYESLIGNNYGVFIYHPWYFLIVLLNILGLIHWKSHHWDVNLVGIFSFTAMICINGLWGSFGDSFGHRAFIETLPILSLGAAKTYDTWIQRPSSLSKIIPYPSLALCSILIILNFHIWTGYLLKKYPHSEPRTISEVYFWVGNK